MPADSHADSRTNAERRSGAPFAKRALGQNFLVDKNVIRRIAAALEISTSDAIVEIGPGRAALTGAIIDAGPRELLLIEKDQRFAEALAALLAERLPRGRVECGDALTCPWERVHELADGLPTGGRLKIAGNLPYNIASPLMWEIASRARGYERAVFMVQKEVADRIVAPPGGKEYGALSVWLQSFATVRKLFLVGPNAFRPRPKIDSAVVEFRPTPLNHTGERDFDSERLSALLKLCFVKRRKQLATILRPLAGEDLKRWFDDNGLDHRIRPENLDPSQFRLLSNFLGSRLAA